MSLLYNCVLVNCFFRYRVSIISLLGRHTIELLELNLHPLFISTNYLELTNAINKASLIISVVFISYYPRILLRSALMRRSPIY